jgi:biopolymer transport protein ExbD
MNPFETGHTRKSNMALQLAPMIDIFTLIIVFLLQGTVIGTTSVAFPSEMNPPQSQSTEDLENSPIVEIYADHVEFKPTKSKIALNAFLNASDTGLFEEKNKIQEYLTRQGSASPKDFSHLNVVADRATNYEVIYKVVKFFKDAGFQSVLFIAQGEAK